MSDTFSFDVLEHTFRCKFHHGIASKSGCQKNNRDLLEGLMKKLQRLRSVAVRTEVLNDDDVIRLGTKLFRALCQVQNTIGADRELRFLELLHTGSDGICVAMYEKGAKRADSMGRRALRARTYTIRVSFAVSQP